MASCREFTFPSSDGVHQVHAMEWFPESGSPRGVVQLVHGISEYIGRYSPFARFLTDHGFAVVGHDHLGHGKTASGREEYGYFADQDGWRHIRNDIRFLRTAADTLHIPGFHQIHTSGFLEIINNVAQPFQLGHHFHQLHGALVSRSGILDAAQEKVNSLQAHADQMYTDSYTTHS